MADKKRGVERYFFILFIIIVLIFAFIIVKPFLSAILSGIILAYIFYPLYVRFNKIIKNKNLCSLILVIFIIIIVLLPLFFVANALIKETFDLYVKAKDVEINLVLPGVLQTAGVENYFKEAISRGSLFISDSVSSFIISIPRRILDAFIILFLMFYLFKDGPEFIKKFKETIPLNKRFKDKITREFSDITYAVVNGLVVTAFVQGIIGGIGFLIFGIANPILWGTLMALLALIPFLGPAFIWLPMGIYQLLLGEKTAGIGILVYGIFIISSIDNIIRPKIIGSRAKINPAIVLIGVVGGINLLGFVGVVVGPLILALLISLLNTYRVSNLAAKG